MVFRKQKYGVRKGYLVLIGGAEDRTHDKTILRRTVELNRAKTVAVIPTATSYPREAGEDYQDAFRRLDVSETHVLDIRYPDEADDPRHLEMVQQADMIFFTGGDQVRLVEILKDSKLLKHIKKRHNEGATIAGTSAGAAAVSHPMIYSEDTVRDEDGYYKQTVKHTLGFGFLPGVTVDTHFIARQRISRLSQFLCSGLSRRGIGVDEDTSLIVAPDKTCEVVGSSLVTFLSSSRLAYTNYHEPVRERREFHEAHGIKLGYLAHGSRFDIKRWKVLPVER